MIKIEFLRTNDDDFPRVAEFPLANDLHFTAAGDQGFVTVVKAATDGRAGTPSRIVKIFAAFNATFIKSVHFFDGPPIDEGGDEFTGPTLLSGTYEGGD